MFTKIKSQYDGKCSKCNRELRAGWDIFYDKDNPDKTKRVLCTNCGKGNDNASPATDLIKTFGFSGVCSNCSNPIDREDESYYDETAKMFLCSACGEIAKTPKADMQLLVTKLEKKFDEISGNNRLIAELLGSLADKLNNIEHNVSLLFARVLPEKKEKTTKPETETK